MYTFLPKKCDYNAFVETCVGVYLSLYISLHRFLKGCKI